MNAESKKRRPLLMAHMISHFPSLEDSEEVAYGLVEGGAEYLEVQFPFSDPSADGPAIQDACSAALDAGFSVDEGFSLVARITERTKTKIFIMSYGSVVFAVGVDEFCRRAKDAGAYGLIVPDLAPGYDEDLYAVAPRNGIHAVPVIAPRISPKRLEEVLALEPDYVYASLRLGITGTHTEVADDVTAFLSRIAHRGTRIMAGFGIHTHDQVTALSGMAHALVVGSAVVRAVAAAKTEGGAVREAARQTVHMLICGGDGLEAKTADRYGDTQGG